MQKNYLNYLISKSRKFAKKYKIFDIILYGSAVKGKLEPRDIDILIILENEDLDKRDLSYEFKNILKEKIKEVDIKTIKLSEFFDSKFLARQGVLIEGYSLVDKVSLSGKFGFDGFTLFTYDLKNLDHNKKTQFVYALLGRKGQGLIKKLNAVKLSRGAFLIPIENSNIFEDFLDNWKINYVKKKTLVSKL